MPYKLPYKFQRRWMIEGTLTCRSPLHIGSGELIERGEWWLKDDAGKAVKISAVMRDVDGQPYIPASALKGSIRGWLEARLGSDHAGLRSAFGFQDERPKDEDERPRDKEKKPEGQGGSFEFLDARLREAIRVELPVTAQTTIDRYKRTVANRKLFHAEYVPAGTVFAVRIAAQNLDEATISLLMEALAAFDHATDPVTLGASSADRWGRMEWRATSLGRLEADGVLAHLKKGHLGFEKLPAVALASLDGERAKWKAELTRLTRPARLRLEIELQFEGGFLVNDPKRTKPKQTDGDEPNHAPILDADGKAYLPASSFRGAFRSQAERILKTIGYTKTTTPSEVTVTSLADAIKDLDPVSKLFGGTGWRSPISVSDFRLGPSMACPEERQEFVAVDRFTGGGADKLKFNADRVYRPVLKGYIEVDLEALGRVHAGTWGLGLLAYTLRDLREGDVGFGFGAAKGFGACSATVRVTSAAASAAQRALLQGAAELPADAVECLKSLADLVKGSHGTVS